MTAQGMIHLLIGPVGAGKTTFAEQWVARAPAVFLDVDTWMVRLYGADVRPEEGVLAWYLERRERCRDLLWDVALSALGCDADVILELGLLTRMEREAFYGKAVAKAFELSVHWLDAPRAQRRERVLLRNQAPGPFTQVVPAVFFERASDAWEPPCADECETWAIVQERSEAAGG